MGSMGAKASKSINLPIIGESLPKCYVWAEKSNTQWVLILTPAMSIGVSLILTSQLNIQQKRWLSLFARPLLSVTEDQVYRAPIRGRSGLS